MAHLITFKTSRFDPSSERSNPINPIAGEGVLAWVRESVLRWGGTATEPDAEDWGWYIGVEHDGSTYLVGASGQFEVEEASAGASLEWLIRVEKPRSLKDRLYGRNKLGSDDAFVGKLADALRSDAAFSDVEVTADA